MQKSVCTKICIPTIDAKEQSSEMCESFGSAPYFTIYDCDTGAYGTSNKSGHEHEHRICNPMCLLQGSRQAGIGEAQ